MKNSKLAIEKTGRDSDRRDEVIDRRAGIDRRDIPTDLRSGAAVPPAQIGADSEPSFAAVDTNLERRRGPGRRRTDFMKSAEEGEMSKEQFLFVMAIDIFKRVNNKTFPTWTDVLEVVRKLGYRKTMRSELNLGPKAEDWTERSDSPSGVFKVAEDEES